MRKVIVLLCVAAVAAVPATAFALHEVGHEDPDPEFSYCLQVTGDRALCAKASMESFTVFKKCMDAIGSLRICSNAFYRAFTSYWRWDYCRKLNPNDPNKCGPDPRGHQWTEWIADYPDGVSHKPAPGDPDETPRMPDDDRTEMKVSHGWVEHGGSWEMCPPWYGDYDPCLDGMDPSMDPNCTN